MVSYCGSDCFKAHKPACIKPAPLPPAPPTQDQIVDTLLADADDLGAHVPIDRLQRLMNDEAIRTAVRDPRLQRVLATIDGSKDPAKALQEARRVEGRQFEAFLDHLLLAIGAAERGPGGVGIVFTGLPQQPLISAVGAAAAQQSAGSSGMASAAAGAGSSSSAAAPG